MGAGDDFVESVLGEFRFGLSESYRFDSIILQNVITATIPLQGSLLVQSMCFLNKQIDLSLLPPDEFWSC